jgi:hypothetical protein
VDSAGMCRNCTPKARSLSSRRLVESLVCGGTRAGTRRPPRCSRPGSKQPKSALPRGGGAPPENPQPSACLLPLPVHTPLALAVVLKTVLFCTSEAPCERDLSELRKRILQHREQRTGARGSFVTGLPPPPFW